MSKKASTKKLHHHFGRDIVLETADAPTRRAWRKPVVSRIDMKPS